MEKKIIKIISEVLGVSEAKITNETGIDDISEWDSIKHMQIIIALEEEYDIEFTEEELVDTNNVKKLCDYILSINKK